MSVAYHLQIFVPLNHLNMKVIPWMNTYMVHDGFKLYLKKEGEMEHFKECATFKLRRSDQ